jgi:hypothetical protein
VLSEIVASLAHGGEDAVDAVQGVAHRLQLLFEELALHADALEQAAALDGQINQLLIHCGQPLSAGSGRRRARRCSPRTGAVRAAYGTLEADVSDAGNGEGRAR